MFQAKETIKVPCLEQDWGSPLTSVDLNRVFSSSFPLMISSAKPESEIFL